MPAGAPHRREHVRFSGCRRASGDEGLALIREHTRVGRQSLVAVVRTAIAGATVESLAAGLASERTAKELICGVRRWSVAGLVVALLACCSCCRASVSSKGSSMTNSDFWAWRPADRRLPAGVVALGARAAECRGRPVTPRVVDGR